MGKIASLAAGVDSSNPNISYMLSIEHNFNRTFINEIGQKGNGLKEYEEGVITDLIVDYETENPDFCACHVGEQLLEILKQKWNHFCSSAPNRYAVSAYVFDEKFIYFRPKRCYHLLYSQYPGLE